MSTPVAVDVQGLSKRYALGRAEERGYRTLRDALARVADPRRWLAPSARSPEPEIWALRDISFAVAEGEALGIIGHNGAGKSTLLKILSRVTEPTAGRARLRGRVASLLEIGTGFHPELTGRENIFLNGSILGMSRGEIRRSFDAIVAFAEVERFLDTPVKRYSSGMYVRLAFAVAAHLTPEILIVDEVLAVGDHEFQRRCLGRMSEVTHGGRTVLFVSHNLRAVEDLCPRTLLLRGGRVEQLGPTREVVAQYIERHTGDGRGQTPDAVDLASFADREGTGRARLTRIELLEAGVDRGVKSVGFYRPFRVRLHWEAQERLPGATVGLALLDERDERIFWTSTDETGVTWSLVRGSGFCDCFVEAPNVLPGAYRLEAWIIDPIAADYADHVRGVGRVRIELRELPDIDVNLAVLTRPERGRVYIRCRWQAS